MANYKITEIRHQWDVYQIGGWTMWFTSVTDTVYKDGNLLSFTWDGVEYTLTYSPDGRVTSVSWGGKTYNMTYINWTLREISESD